MTARSSRTGPDRGWSPPAVASPRCTRRGRTPCDSYRHPACRRPVVRGVVHSGELDADAARWLSAALLTLVGFGRLSIRLCAGAGVVGWQEIGRGRLGRCIRSGGLGRSAVLKRPAVGWALERPAVGWAVLAWSGARRACFGHRVEWTSPNGISRTTSPPPLTRPSRTPAAEMPLG